MVYNSNVPRPIGIPIMTPEDDQPTSQQVVISNDEAIDAAAALEDAVSSCSLSKQ